MRLSIVFAITAFTGGCLEPEEPQFHDKGHGIWIAMPDVPDLDYRAIWGASEHQVYAVGQGGVATYDGDSWTLASDVPTTEYRAVWGRSASQVWIGGDGVLLARSLTGWQEQTLWHDGLQIVDYSVLVLTGDVRQEYALVLTGGKLLLLINEGAAWETPWWRGSSGPNRALPPQPSAIVSFGKLLIAGDLGLLTCQKSDFTWEARTWSGGYDVPALTTISGGSSHWVAAGGAELFVQREYGDELIVLDDEREAIRPRDVNAVFAPTANRFFAVGNAVHLRAPDALSGVLESPIEACDQTGCAQEMIQAGYETTPLHAVWGDGAETVMAVGNGVIFNRFSKQTPAE